MVRYTSIDRHGGQRVYHDDIKGNSTMPSVVQSIVLVLHTNNTTNVYPRHLTSLTTAKSFAPSPGHANKTPPETLTKLSLVIVGATTGNCKLAAVTLHV